MPYAYKVDTPGFTAAFVTEVRNGIEAVVKVDPKFAVVVKKGKNLHHVLRRLRAGAGASSSCIS
jgi:hypothetical protein